MQTRRFTRPLRRRFIYSCLLVGALVSSMPHSVRTQEQKEPDDVVRVKSNLVNIDVMVKDKKGKYIPDLKVDDFVVFENGVPQKLEFFEAPLLHVSTQTKTADAAARVEAVAEAVPAKNYVSLVLDSQTTDLTNLKQVREGTIKFVKEQISDADAVALFSISGGLQLLQPFTQDKSKLIAALESFGTSAAPKNTEQRDIAGNIDSLRTQLGTSPSGPTTAISTAAGGSEAAKAAVTRRVLQQFIKLRTALSLQQSRPVLAALAAISEGLRSIPGKKTVVLFSQGFVTPTVLDWQIQSTIDIANRANVAIYIIDSAGLREGGTKSGALVPGSPLAGVSAMTSQEQRIQAVGGETVFDISRQEGTNREYDILYRMSGDTGGRFLKDNNDIAQGLQRINEEIQARYTLSYRSTNQNFDGSFRKVKIEVRRPNSQIVSRSGYYAIPPEEIVLLSPDDKKLLANLDSIAAAPGLPLHVEVGQFRSREGLYTVPILIEVPPAAVRFETKADKRTMQLDVLGVVRTTSDTVLARLGGNFSVNLAADEYQSILNNNIFYRQDVELAPGEYSIELVVKDRQSGKISARKEKLVLADADSQFSTNNVVLSRHVELAALKLLGSSDIDVFTYGRAKIRPSPARRFQPSDNLIMFFQIYNAASSPDTGKPMVRVTVRLMKDGQPATKFFDYVLTDLQPEPTPHLTLAEYIKLSGLSPGKYVAMIETKDMVTRKVVRQEAPFVIQ